MSLPSVRRITVATSVALGAGLAFAGFLLQPPAPPGDAAGLAAAASDPLFIVGVQLYVFSQVFWAIGLVGVGHLASRRSPILGTLGAVLSGLGAFGHAVYGGVLLMQIALADDPAALEAAQSVSESAIFVPYLLLGLGGTVLGAVFIAVAVIRSRVAPLWVPIALLAWVVTEFALTALAGWAYYGSMVLGVIVFGALAVAVWRSEPAAWRTELETRPRAGAAAVSVGAAAVEGGAPA